jgi:hypothetical protein
MKNFVLAIALLSSIIIGCGGTSGGDPGTRDPTGQDATCTVSLSESGCPPTYEAAVTACRTNSASRATQGDSSAAGSCGAVLLYRMGTPFGPNYCAYDPTSHALTGAQVASDTLQYCHDSSFTAQSGAGADGSCSFMTFDCEVGDGG